MENEKKYLSRKNVKERKENDLMVTRLTGNGLPPPFCIWSWKTGGNLRRTLGSKSGWPSCKSRSGFSETRGGQACNDKRTSTVKGHE